MLRALFLLFGVANSAGAEPADEILQRCLECHVDGAGQIDIIGLRVLEALPPEWPFLFEDEFDLDGDGIAGRMRFVSGGGTPLVAKYGEKLAAGRFEDFALIAGAAHGITIPEPTALAKVKAGFEARSPNPVSPFASEAERLSFEARGCASCHVTRTFSFEGRTYAPLSDFLLHDLGEGERRTAPLWGCRTCVLGNPHDVSEPVAEVPPQTR